MSVFRTPSIIQWLNDLYLFEGNQHVQFFTVQLDAQQNFTHLGSPAPQDLSKALFMAVTWRCNMPSQGHETKEKMEKLTPGKTIWSEFFKKWTTSTPNQAPIFYFTEFGNRSLFNVPLQFVKLYWLVVSNIVYFHPYLGKISHLTNILQMGWNHHLVYNPAHHSTPLQVPLDPPFGSNSSRDRISPRFVGLRWHRPLKGMAGMAIVW